MIRIIKLGNLIYENIEPKYVDPQTNQEVWNIPNDLATLQNAYIDTLDWLTERYIEDKFKSLNENLSDLISEQGVIEYKFYVNGIDPSLVKNGVFDIVDGLKTVTDIMTELTIPTILQPVLERAVEIAKLLKWKESIWGEELNIENQIKATITIDELLAIDLKQAITAYDNITII